MKNSLIIINTLNTLTLSKNVVIIIKISFNYINNYNVF